MRLLLHFCVALNRPTKCARKGELRVAGRITRRKRRNQLPRGKKHIFPVDFCQNQAILHRDLLAPSPKNHERLAGQVAHPVGQRRIFRRLKDLTGAGRESTCVCCAPQGLCAAQHLAPRRLALVVPDIGVDIAHRFGLAVQSSISFGFGPFAAAFAMSTALP